ncbi:MAG: hypothetical protein P4M11_14970 [Candidatus Pacebacteria bacterium]|nr:hypothetical protein [Candidatus Paceibacterota bacterium]
MPDPDPALCPEYAYKNPVEVDRINDMVDTDDEIHSYFKKEKKAACEKQQDLELIELRQCAKRLEEEIEQIVKEEEELMSKLQARRLDRIKSIAISLKEITLPHYIKISPAVIQEVAEKLYDECTAILAKARDAYQRLTTDSESGSVP